MRGGKLRLGGGDLRLLAADLCRELLYHLGFVGTGICNLRLQLLRLCNGVLEIEATAGRGGDQFLVLLYTFVREIEFCATDADLGGGCFQGLAQISRAPAFDSDSFAVASFCFARASTSFASSCFTSFWKGTGSIRKRTSPFLTGRLGSTGTAMTRPVTRHDLNDVVGTRTSRRRDEVKRQDEDGNTHDRADRSPGWRCSRSLLNLKKISQTMIE